MMLKIANKIGGFQGTFSSILRAKNWLSFYWGFQTNTFKTFDEFLIEKAKIRVLMRPIIVEGPKFIRNKLLIFTMDNNKQSCGKLSMDN